MGKLKLPKLKFKMPFKISIKKKKKVEGTASLFFGSDKPIKFNKEKIDNLIDLFFDKYQKLVEKVQKEQNDRNEITHAGMSKERLHDFFANSFNFTTGGTGFGEPMRITGMVGGFDAGGIRELPEGTDIAFDGNNEPSLVKTEAPVKVKKKPIEVFNELEKLPSPVSLDNLEQKIEILKKKAKLTDQMYSQYDIKAAIQCLENRRKYDEYKEFYNKFPYTFSDKIDDLCSKYDLVLKSSEIFVPEFPDEAVEIMSAYQETTQKLCGKKPVFYVIATQENFKKKYEKRDPILLVQSPFGFFWNLLGAWDSEMILLSEL